MPEHPLKKYLGLLKDLVVSRIPVTIGAGELNPARDLCYNYFSQTFWSGEDTMQMGQVLLTPQIPELGHL